MRRGQEGDGKTAEGRASGAGKGVFAAVIVAVGRYRETHGSRKRRNGEEGEKKWSMGPTLSSSYRPTIVC